MFLEGTTPTFSRRPCSPRYGLQSYELISHLSVSVLGSVGAWQVPAWAGYELDYTAALVGFVLCVIGLAMYCVYQVLSPDLQKKKMQAAHDTARRHSTVRPRLPHAEWRCPCGSRWRPRPSVMNGDARTYVLTQCSDPTGGFRSGKQDLFAHKAAVRGEEARRTLRLSYAMVGIPRSLA